MIRRLSEWLESTEEVWLEGVEPEVVEDELAKRIAQKSLEKIKTPQKSEKYLRKRNYLGLIAVVAILAAIGVGAVTISPILMELYKDNFSIISPNAQVIQKSVVSNGVRMTVDTAITDESGGLVIVCLTREDGAVFEEDIQLRELEVKVDGEDFGSVSKGWELSADATKLYYIIRLIEHNDILGENVTIKAKDLVRLKPNDQVMPIALAALVNQTFEPIRIWVEEQGEIKLIGANHQEDNLELIFETPKIIEETEGGVMVNQWKPVSQRAVLWNKNTGKVEIDDGMSSETSTREVMCESVIYENITEEALKALKFVLLKNDIIPYLENEWCLEFKLEKNKNVKGFKGKHVIEHAKGNLEIHHIQVSVLGGVIEGHFYRNDPNADVFKVFEQGMKVGLKDGSEVVIHQTLGRSGTVDLDLGIDEFSIHFEAGEDTWRQYTDEEREQAYIQGMGQMMNRVTGLEGLIQTEFMDIEQIEWIEINQVRLPLK